MNYQYQSQAHTRSREIDEGLRAYMLRVYNYMFAALVVTGLVSAIVLTSPAMLSFVQSPFIWVVFLAKVAIVWTMGARVHTLKPSTSQALFWVYSCLMGLVLGGIMYNYTGTSITRVFFIAASIFGAMSIYGYTTKKSLDTLGKLCFFGLIGMIVAGLVNIFLGSSMLHFLLSFAGVIIFTGLTAYDTQKIKELYLHNSSAAHQLAVFGALQLYMDFVYLFIYLLQILGSHRD